MLLQEACTGGVASVTVLPSALLDELRSIIEQGGGALPLPALPPPPRPASRSRRIQERFRRAEALWKLASRAVIALNELGGFKQHEGVPAARRLRRRVGVESNPFDEPHLRLLQAVRSLHIARRDDPTGGDWRQEMRITREELYMSTKDKLEQKYVPVVAAAIAEPRLDAPYGRLLDLLPPCLARVYAGPEVLLRAAWDSDGALQRDNQCYDSVLGPHSEYVAYFSRPQRKAMKNLKSLIRRATRHAQIII